MSHGTLSETLRRIIISSHHQGNMKGAKIKAKANMEFMVKLRWKNGEVLDALQNILCTTPPKKSEVNKLVI